LWRGVAESLPGGGLALTEAVTAARKSGRFMPGDINGLLFTEYRKRIDVALVDGAISVEEDTELQRFVEAALLDAPTLETSDAHFRRRCAVARREMNLAVEDVTNTASVEYYAAFETEAVGESFRQDVLERIAGGRRARSARLKCRANLELEDDNPHDLGNAVRVDIGDECVGYLSRAHAALFREQLAKAEGGPYDMATVDALIVGGWEPTPHDDFLPYFGVRLDIYTGAIPQRKRRRKAKKNVDATEAPPTG
jgi:hypothetical protein